jgi:hypothetical protein
MGIFMLSQSGFAKAKLLNMHTKVLIRPFDKGRPHRPGSAGERAAWHSWPLRFITGPETA